MTAYADPAAARFSLWSIHGRKTLVHDGDGLLLTDWTLDTIRRVAIEPDLADGMPYGYSLPAGNNPSQYELALRGVLELVSCHTRSAGRWLDRPSRASLVAMRTLQALDGAAAGASQRAIAEVLFGGAAVAQRWAPDGELRAQLRHLLRRGRELRDDGYHRLLGGTATPEMRSGRSNLPEQARRAR